MHPFFQGKVDNFCAVYAVLNAVQLLCKIPPLTARSLFNETILEASGDKQRFKAILEHTTDYMELVDWMLDAFCPRYGLHAFAPFETTQNPDKIWTVLAEYARPDLGRCSVFRFMRFEALRSSPMADHWTTSRTVESDGLRLFDCSLEPRGLYMIRPQDLARAPGLHAREYVVIPAEHIRIVTTS